MTIITITIYLIILIGISFLYYNKVKNLPLHPDTAEFLYPGLIKSLNQIFIPYKAFLNRRWWTGTLLDPIINFLGRIWKKQKRAKHNILFPPYPYCEIGFSNQILEGGNPFVQQKMAIYQLYAFLGKYFKNIAVLSRLLQCAIILCIGLFTFVLLNGNVLSIVRIISALFIVFILILPFFDSYQVHSELYGLFVTVIIFTLLMSNKEFGISYQLAGMISGIFLVFITIFFKVTFIQETVFFLFSPFFIQNGEIFKPLILGEFTGCLFVLLCFAGTPYFTKLMVILNPINILRYRKNIPSMQFDNSNSYDDSKNINRAASEKSIWFYSNFLKLFNIGISCFTIVGILIGLYLFNNIRNLFGFLLLWSLGSLFLIKAQGKFYAAHFIPALFPLTFLWGVTLNSVLTKSYSVLLNTMINVVLLLILAIPIFIIGLLFYKYFIFQKSFRYFLTSYLNRRNPHLLPLIAAEKIGYYVKEHTEPEDRIFSFGYTNTVYQYAQRRASLEFLEGSLGIDPDIANSMWEDRWKWWVCRDIYKFKPKFIIDMDGRFNINAINKLTGLKYILNKTFYKCFNVFILESDNAPKYFGGGEDIDHLVLKDSESYQKRLAFNRALFQNGINNIDIFPEGLRQLIIDWKQQVSGAM